VRQIRVSVDPAFRKELKKRAAEADMTLLEYTRKIAEMGRDGRKPKKAYEARFFK
jgi:hypothetical protein